MEVNEYRSYKDLPPLAGLCSMQDAVQCNWSVEQSVERLKRLHYVLKHLSDILIRRITSEPIYELKTALSHHAYICSEQVHLIRRRVAEMREPPLGLEQIPHPALELLMDEIRSAVNTQDFLAGTYHVLLPEIVKACRSLRRKAHPLADAPTIRVARLIEFEIQDVIQFGEQAVKCLQDDDHRGSDVRNEWLAMLQTCLQASGGLAGDKPATVDLPERQFSSNSACYDSEPKRDERFIDPYNAGVNPEAFLYDDRFSTRDKTLMMYYKRIRELDVPEMMASILVELADKEPWEFHYEMIRQLWDEARHAMMGEVGFASLGIDWAKIPINFTWSKNLNEQLTARERHGVLFFIEQGLMPKTGKRFEWEVALASGDPLSALFQDFDWADEVLHAQIGRRWYVPKFESLAQALEYGDKCWSKVLSHWKDYRDQGLTEHRNWWPEIYVDACRRWQVEPDPAAMEFAETYEDRRADLKSID